MLLEGKQFNHYRILQLIGRGGMGEVYLAEDTQILRQIAIKFIRVETEIPDQESAVKALRLFWREATAIARLDHANILPLHDHGEITLEGSALAYLVMPYRPEGSLATWLRQRGPDRQAQQLSLKQIGHLLQQAGMALQYAHDHQVMHLDVKSTNFLMRNRLAGDEYPDMLLSDFGMARLANASSSFSQNVRGTPTYMAPEQWDNRPVFASDQYALAIMVYELLTGKAPFQGSPMNIMYAHMHELPRSVCDLNPFLPKAVDLILQRALAKKPDERYPSISAFAQAFQSVPGESTLELRTTGAPPAPHPGASSSLFDSHPLAPGSAQLPSDTLPRLILPLQSPVSRSLAVPRQTDLLAQTSSHFSKEASIPVTLSGESSARLSMHPATQTNLTSDVPTNPPPVISTRPDHRRPRPLVIGLLLLSLLVLVGASIGVYSINSGKWPGSSAQRNTNPATATISSQRNTGNGTATARAQKTTRPNDGHAYPSYLPGHGIFALFDPLSQPDYWHNQADSDTNGKCQFTGSAFHAFEFSSVRTFHCDGPSFSDFAFEVQMTIIQGDCGGITFRYNMATHDFYQFDVCLDLDNGEYYLFSVANNNYSTLKENSISTLISGLNHPILLAVVAQGSMITLFVNRQQITSVQDTSYTQGNLALTARDDQSRQTEVVYRNATVWNISPA